MTNVSDELVKQAARASLGWTDEQWRRWGTHLAAHRALLDCRRALSAVLPVIERPWREKVERLEAENSEIKHEILGLIGSASTVGSARKSAVQFASEMADLKALLVERDQKIERLRAELQSAYGEVERWRDRFDAVDRQFSDAEREALLDGLNGSGYGCEDDDCVACAPIRSARAKLEAIDNEQ